MITRSRQETATLAETIASQLKGGEVLLLSGELGSGKTTFVQALARSLGINEPVRSPTYVLRQDFEIVNHSTIVRLIHIDLYRLTENNLADLDLQDIIHDPKTITAIEWPERAGNFAWPKKTKRFCFAHGTKPNERVIVDE